MAGPILVDHRGDPLRRPATAADLKGVVAAASLTGVRQAWNAQTVASGLTPERLARIMRQAAEGDHHDYVVLAEEMEERDWHYAACLAQRKLAVLGLARVVTAASDAADDVKIADACRELVEDEAFEDLLAGALDALGKGWSAVEIAWDTAGSVWKPGGSAQWGTYEWCDPRFFRWDRETGRQLRLIDEQDPAFGIELPPYRFAIHKPQLKMGLPVRGGLARLAAWAFLFKFYSVKDWAAFAETYGQPLRVGKYDPAATQADIDVLYQAVAMIGTDCAAVIPQAMQIEFVNAMQGSSQTGAQIYDGFCTFLDRQVSKAVLGQTGTTDMQKGGGYAQAKVLDGVRDDLRDSDAKQLARTVRRDVFGPYVGFNFGSGATIPGLKLQAEEGENLVELADALGPFIDRGLKIKASQIREKFDLEAPERDDEVLQATGRGSEDLTAVPPTRALNRRHGAGCRCAGCAPRARNRPAEPAGDDLDQLVMESGWEPDLDPLVEPIERLAAGCSSYAEFKAALDDAAGRMDISPLARSLALQMFKARGLGDATDQPTV